MDDDETARRRQGNRERQRRFRERRRQRRGRVPRPQEVEESDSVQDETYDYDDEDVYEAADSNDDDELNHDHANDIVEDVNFREVELMSMRLRRFFVYELEQCQGDRTREAVIEAFMGSDDVQQQFPSYYPPPIDARAQQLIIGNIKQQLDYVKGVHSTKKLQYRGVILDAAVNGEGEGPGQIIPNARISKVLGIKTKNIVKARTRRQILQSTGSSQLALANRRKRADALKQAVVDLAVKWWTDETRVSPITKETRRQRIDTNSYRTHPTHLLEETLVKFPYPLYNLYVSFVLG